ncbi:MAG: hypothetical protein QGG14_00940 [Planctomycetota bacterium]|nr:hypothetical protein [Planctomycetota bacterium]
MSAGCAAVRIPDWVWILALLCIGAWGLWDFEYVADDLLVLRTYTAYDGAEAITTRWSRVAEDFVGPWGANPEIELYRPVASIWLALNFTLFGACPLSSALGNLAIHAASVLLIWRIGRRILPGTQPALIGAMLFAATPLAHEDLAWAVGNGLNLTLSLTATLVFLRRYERGRRGRSLHAPVVALLAAAMLTYEQALFWTLFPVVALVVASSFGKISVPERGMGWVKLAAPHAVLIPLYIVLRVGVLGSLAGGMVSLILPTDLAGMFTVPLHRLIETLAPLDESFLAQGAAQTVWRWLCLLPIAMGLLALFHLRDPRSVGYRRAFFVLLAFWLMTRVPNLGMELRAGLDWGRVSYYGYPPLALLSGLLIATVRYSRWLVYLLVVLFAVNLQHRVAERCQQGAMGVAASRLLVDEAERRGAVQGQGDKRLCYVSRVDGIAGAPAYQPGEMAYALYPPLAPVRVRGLNLHPLIRREEFFAAAAMANAAGGLVSVGLGTGVNAGLTLQPHDLAPYLTDKPDAGLRPRLDAGRITFSEGWRREPGCGDAQAVVVLVAGAVNIVAPSDSDRIRAALDTWRQRGGPGAEIAFLVELRTSAGDPATCLARSEVVFAQL